VFRINTSTLAVAFVVAVASSAHAAVTGIDSVTLNVDNSLDTATVGGTAFEGGVIADQAQANIGNPLGPVATGDALVSGSDMIDLAPLTWDNDVLTGSAGGQGQGQTGGILQLFWGTAVGGFTDNDSDPDFFVFEDSGNDDVEIRAILANDTYGEAVLLSGWNSVSNDGVLNDGEFTGRDVQGVAFELTDLLDASGNNLTNGMTIKGIWIGDAGAADFYEVYANVNPIPEPASLALLALGGLTLIRRRRVA
jgi:hypothetical protein